MVIGLFALKLAWAGGQHLTLNTQFSVKSVSLLNSEITLSSSV